MSREILALEGRKKIYSRCYSEKSWSLTELSNLSHFTDVKRQTGIYKILRAYLNKNRFKSSNTKQEVVRSTPPAGARGETL